MCFFSVFPLYYNSSFISLKLYIRLQPIWSKEYAEIFLHVIKVVKNTREVTSQSRPPCVPFFQFKLGFPCLKTLKVGPVLLSLLCCLLSHRFHVKRCLCLDELCIFPASDWKCLCVCVFGSAKEENSGGYCVGLWQIFLKWFPGRSECYKIKVSFRAP